MEHSIELKFDMYMIGQRRTKPNGFDERRFNNFFLLQEYKKYFFSLWPLKFIY